MVGHEITHVLEGTDLYDSLKKAVEAWGKTKGIYETRLKELTELYQGKKGYTGEEAAAKIEREVVADLIGDYLFTDKAFVENLAKENPGLFQRILEEIKYLCKLVTAGSKEARQLEKVKKIFQDVYRDASQEGVKNPTGEGGVKFSLENSGKRKYNKKSKYNETETLFLSWENGSAPVGAVKKFVRYGKIRYYEKTENGCVELSRSQYNERNGAYVENIDRRAEREIGEAYGYDESTQRGTPRHSDSDRDTGGIAAVFGQAFRKELSNDTGGSVPISFGYDYGTDINNTDNTEEASDDSGASSVTWSNDYAAIRNFMKEGDTKESDVKNSLSAPGQVEAAGGGWDVRGQDVGLPMPKGYQESPVAGTTQEGSKTAQRVQEAGLPMPEDIAHMEQQSLDQEYRRQMGEVDPSLYESDEDEGVETTRDKLEVKQQNLRWEHQENQRKKEAALQAKDQLIEELQAKYDAKKHKDSKSSQALLRRINREIRLRSDIAAEYDQKNARIQNQIGKIDEKLQTSKPEKSDRLEKAFKRIDARLKKKPAG